MPRLPRLSGRTQDFTDEARRRHVAIGICLAVALGLSMSFALAGSAYATTPVAHASRRISPLLAKEIAVLTDQGLSTARAIEAIEAQSRIAEASLPGRLQAAMGSAYAGVWFDPAAAKLHVGVTSPAARRTASAVVRQAGVAGYVTYTHVHSTSAQLIATQTRWNHRLAGMFAREEVTTGLQPQNNAVSVRLDPSVRGSQRSALQREAASSSVKVLVTVAAAHLHTTAKAKECNDFTSENANCEPSITGGVFIWSKIVCDKVAFKVDEELFKTQKQCEERKVKGSEGEWVRLTDECSAGLPAIPVANKTQRVLLTAGHCLADGEGIEWFAFKRNLEEPLIGKARKFLNGGGTLKGDLGEILIESAPAGGWQTGNAEKPVLAVTAEWGKTEETRYPIKEERLPVVGNENCHEGATIGEWCGLIMTVNVSYTTTEGIEYAGTVEDLKLISEGGDSGGDVIFVNMANEAIAEGTLAAGSRACRSVASKLGDEFFQTEAACLTPTKGMEGTWERDERTYWEPLMRTEAGLPEGSLEYLKLELLTTANEGKAAHPLFYTQSGKELLFSGTGTKPVLRAEVAGLAATVECEKALVDGFALHFSTLAHRILIQFHGKCVQKVGTGGNEACKEPIIAKKLLAELGLLTSTNKKVVLLLVPSDGTTTFAEVECASMKTTVSGPLVGEIPENNALGEKQINVARSEIEVVFATIGKTNKQSITEVFLLGSQMTAQELKVSGFFGGKAAEELTVGLKGDGTIEISTTKT